MSRIVLGKSDGRDVKLDFDVLLRTRGRPGGEGESLHGNDAHSRKRLPARLVKALHAEWAKLSPNLEIERLGDRAIEDFPDPERALRLWWTNEQIAKSLNRQSPITSWSQLTTGQAKYLLKKMREESGSGPAYRAQLIACLAVELWGSDWDAFLRERVCERFRLSTLEALTPSQAHDLIEESLSRIARRDGVEIEDVRKRLATIRR